MESGGAVSVTTGAAGLLIAKLAALMGDETIEIQEGVRQDMRYLKDDLRSINALLVNLAGATTWEEEPQEKIWRSDFREMTFSMDDSIDLVLAGGFAVTSAGARCLHILPLPAVQDLGYRMAALVRKLKAMLEQVKARYERYRLGDIAASRPSMFVDPRLLALFRDDCDIIGIHSQRQELIKRLIDGGGHLKVISIVGLAGLGKTTLAKLVCQAIREQFECLAFVSLSPDPDMKIILRTLLSKVGATENYDSSSEWDISRLAYTLREFLSSRRYFVVVDDLWCTLAWRTIKSALPDSLGSRILTTTRIISVAMSCCHPNENLVYEMKPLTDDDARILFFKTVFGNEDCPPEMEGVSADILKICGGLPLGIMSVSSLLSSRGVTAEKCCHVRDSIEQGLGDICSQDWEMTIRSLYLSYMELPLQLRTCLLYLTMFPRNYVVNRDRLIKRWIAEGFIAAKRGKSLQQVGEWCFSELINRTIIQPVWSQSNNQADACQVHSIIFYFIALISTEENFVTLYADNSKNIYRRLSVDNRHQQDSKLPLRGKTHQVRSLSIFGSVLGIPPLSDFGALRVLDMEIDGELESHYLDDIAHLLHLKYLRLQTTSTVELAKIEKLQYLETLDLTRTPVSVLPDAIVLLKRLKHLLVNNVKLPDGIGKMQCLSELSRVKVDSSNSTDCLKELGSLTKLRVLGLNWCISDMDDQVETYVDNLVSSLNMLSRCNLQSLYIASNDGCSMDFLLDAWSPPPFLQEFQMDTKYCLPRIPEWMVSHLNLAFLDINVDSVEQHALQTLGALPALLVLLLSSKKSPSPKLGLRIGSDEFYCLQRFNFTCWNSWGVVMFEPGAMPQLKKLELVCSAKWRCDYDGSEFGIEHLCFLKHLCVKINVWDASALEIEAAEAAIQRAANKLPFHPITEVTRWNEEEEVTA